MAPQFDRPLRDLLRAAGCTLVRQGKGSHEIWYSPITKRNFAVPIGIPSRHTANAILRQAGLPKGVLNEVARRVDEESAILVIASRRVRPEVAGPMTGSAKQSSLQPLWIASSLSLLAMTHAESSCPGLSRASTSLSAHYNKTWMAGSSPAMTAKAVKTPRSPAGRRK
jgi:hypothetical protein